MNNIRFRDAALIKLILVAAILSFWWFGQARGQFATQEPKSRSFVYSLTGEAWLKVYRANDAKDPDSWHPSYTFVSSTYRPVVVKRGDRYEITFRSVGLQSPDLP